jgi:hypothetical protein
MAGAAVATTFAATLGLGATFGLFGMTEPDGGVGDLEDARPVSAVQAGVQTDPGLTQTRDAAVLPDD